MAKKYTLCLTCLYLLMTNLELVENRTNGFQDKRPFEVLNSQADASPSTGPGGAGEECGAYLLTIALC